LEHFEVLHQLSKENIPFVVVTMLAGRGHTPQIPGAKAIVTRDGLVHGTVGGGKIEAQAIRHSQSLLAGEMGGSPQVITWNLQKDIGMSCGGEGTYLFEVFNPFKWKIAVFGAGHIAQALTRTLLNLDCFVTCLDARRDWLDRLPNHPKLKKICSDNIKDFVSHMDNEHFFTVMTQGHATDVPVLAEIFKIFPAAPYIGVIGSQAKAIKIKRDLKEMGISESYLGQLKCPMGLRVGSSEPFEISISVAAELLQFRDSWLSRSRTSAKEGNRFTNLLAETERANQ